MQTKKDLLLSLRWIRAQLHNNLTYSCKRTILDAYIVGSIAKGTANQDSDLDIAFIIYPVEGKTSLQLTESYHQKFTNDSQKPTWNGRVVDVQFFYKDDSELKNYTKIKLI